MVVSDGDRRRTLALRILFWIPTVAFILLLVVTFAPADWRFFVGWAATLVVIGFLGRLFDARMRRGLPDEQTAATRELDRRFGVASKYVGLGSVGILLVILVGLVVWAYIWRST